MRYSLPLLIVLCCSVLPAQDVPARPTPPAPLPAPSAEALAGAKTRLANALQKSAALVDTTFTMTWGPNLAKDAGNANNQANAIAFAILGNRIGMQSEGKCRGSWHQDLRCVAFDDDEGDELRLVGGRTIAKDQQRDWTLRQGHFADGNGCDFVPDPQRLLQVLADMPLEVVWREVGSLDDRPVEIVTATLTREQLGEALWAGAVPPAFCASTSNVFRMMGRAGGKVQRGAAEPPDATVDVAVYLDPATSLVQQVQLRSWMKDDIQRGGAGVVVVRGGAIQANGGGEEEEEDEEVGKQEPLRYEQGLPLRSRKKTTVTDVTVRLADHGKTAAPTLDERQRRLLGR